jgi:hypothetical protein
VNIPSGNLEDFYHIVLIKSVGISAQLQGALAGETDRRLLADSPICGMPVRAGRAWIWSDGAGAMVKLTVAETLFRFSMEQGLQQKSLAKDCWVPWSASQAEALRFTISCQEYRRRSRQ